MEMNPLEWIRLIWVAVGIYWLVEARGGKKVAKTEPTASRVLHLVLIAAAFALLFAEFPRVGILGARWLPLQSWFGWLGFGLTAAGCAFAVWARLHLGANWSATVTVKKEHELVRSGPYTVVRHPIYSGFLLAILGTAVALGEVRGVLALLLAFVGWFTKSQTEEKFMSEQFGPAYVRYRQEVKRLIPFVL
jgi:protein-S-isoprenylcysteine O-methyltransferase Ste14